MRCPNCGTENQGGRTLCTRCGTRLRVPTGGATGAPASDPASGLMDRLRYDLRRLAVAMAIVVVVALLVGNFLR